MKRETLVVSARIDDDLYAKIEDYANSNEGGIMSRATEKLLKLGLESLTKKPETPTCPSCGEPLAAVHYLCIKEQKIIRGDYWANLIKDTEELARNLYTKSEELSTKRSSI